MKKIVVLGSTNTDMVIAGKKIPVPGETVCGGSFLMNPGGKGANQAVAVARLQDESCSILTVKYTNQYQQVYEKQLIANFSIDKNWKPEEN